MGSGTRACECVRGEKAKSGKRERATADLKQSVVASNSGSRCCAEAGLAERYLWRAESRAWEGSTYGEKYGVRCRVEESSEYGVVDMESAEKRREWAGRLATGESAIGRLGDSGADRSFCSCIVQGSIATLSLSLFSLLPLFPFSLFPFRLSPSPPP